MTDSIKVNAVGDLAERFIIIECKDADDKKSILSLLKNGYEEDSIGRISATSKDRALRWHPKGLSSWSMSDWAVALAGECGELCDVVKKLNRVRDELVGNKVNGFELRSDLVNEIADVYLYLDLFAQAAGVDLYQAVKTKFNETSVQVGFPERL